MVYFQWFQLIKELPISWMPESVFKGWEGVSHGNVIREVTGRAASLDCLSQAWNLWQGETMDGIATNVFMRATIRYGLPMLPLKPYHPNPHKDAIHKGADAVSKQQPARAGGCKHP